MDILTKKRLLIGSIVILLIMNVSAIGTIVYNNYRVKKHIEKVRQSEKFHKGPKYGERRYGERVKKYVRRELNLSDEQFAEYSSLKDKNMQKTADLWKQINEKRKLTYQEYCKEIPDTAFLYRLSEDIGSLHKQLHSEMIHHYIEVEKILTPEQQEKFRKMLCKMMKHRQKIKNRPHR